LALTLQERIVAVGERVARACAASGRDVHDVKVIAVTKYVSLKTVAEVLETKGPGILSVICRPIRLRTLSANLNIYIH